MQSTICATRCAEAAAELVRHEKCEDGVRITDSLTDGLTQLRNFLYRRLQDSVDRTAGSDLLTTEASSRRMEDRTKFEIEIYQIAVSASQTHENHYIRSMEWYAAWLTQLRFGDSDVREPVRSRLAEYAQLTPADRRLHFTNVLVASCREAGYAPLVLFRLFPLSVRIATSVAFGDQFAAAEVRNQQIDFLPGIADCHDCHGRPLENGEMCKTCGNPVWTHTWMTAVD